MTDEQTDGWGVIGDGDESMNWPNAGERLDSLAYVLRYGTPTKSELLSAAGVLWAYREILTCSNDKRAFVVRELSAKRKTGADPSESSMADPNLVAVVTQMDAAIEALTGELGEALRAFDATTGIDRNPRLARKMRQAPVRMAAGLRLREAVRHSMAALATRVQGAKPPGQLSETKRELLDHLDALASQPLPETCSPEVAKRFHAAAAKLRRTIDGRGDSGVN